MKKEVRVVDKEKGIVRVTTTDERWYAIPSDDPVTKLPSYRYIPSVTWICGHYPKGIAFYKWLADKGWDESQALKQAAGDKGSKIHAAIEALIAGGEVKLDDKLMNNTTGEMEELTTEEWEAILSFVLWANEVKPKFLISEMTVLSEQYGFAGTVDAVVQIEDQVYIVDFKSSQYVWPEYELQISAYKQALSEMGRKTENAKLAILQVGYKRNKKGYKFTEIEDQFPLFLAARQIWEKECAGQTVAQKDLPIVAKLEVAEEEKPEEVKSKKVKKQ